MTLEEKILTALQKDAPTVSGVHVPTAMGNEDERLQKAEEELMKRIFSALDEDEEDEFEDEELEKEFQEDHYDVSEMWDMQDLVEGMDFELAQNEDYDEETALADAEMNLQKDPDHYKKLWANADGASTMAIKEGLRLDLGSGQCREPGHVGYDLYPHDRGTVVHDLTLGIPAPDRAAKAVRLVNSMHYMEGLDQKKLLNEIGRVMGEGGLFHYEGPEELSDLPNGFELLNKESNELETEKPWHKQVFKYVVPDAATSDDAYPRVSPDNYAPLDQILGGTLGGYYYSDATSAARTNRLYGYPSQGAVDMGEISTKSHDINNINQLEESILNFLEEEKTEKNHLIGNVLQKGHDYFAALVKFVIGKEAPAAPRRVATIAVMHEGKLLMGKRRDNGKWTVPGGHADEGEDMLVAAKRELMEEAGIGDAEHMEQITELADVSKDQDGSLNVQCFKVELSHKPSTTMKSDPDGEVYRWKWVDTANGLPVEISQNMHVPLERNALMQKLGIKENIGKSIGRKAVIAKLDKAKQLVYGVVLTPDEVDAQEDFMTAEDIEKAAHYYMENSRTVGSGHEKAIKAVVVESYIAPVEFKTEGSYGPQSVKKGAWVLCVKVLDKKEWDKVVEGEYQAFSVGGFGIRT